MVGSSVTTISNRRAIVSMINKSFGDMGLWLIHILQIGRVWLEVFGDLERPRLGKLSTPRGECVIAKTCAVAPLLPRGLMEGPREIVR